MSEEKAKEEQKQDAPDTLLVIGNGFDLWCGLNSRFSDYFNASKDMSRLTFWDDFLLFLKKVMTIFHSQNGNHLGTI